VLFVLDSSFVDEALRGTLTDNDMKVPNELAGELLSL
jgi:hypothetical protein